MIFFVALFASALLLHLVRAQAPQQWQQYSGNLTLSIDAYDIHEPIEIWYDKTHKLQRIDYYGGMDTTILKRGMAFNLFPTPESNSSCSKLPYKWLGEDYVEVIPDLSLFNKSANTEEVTVDGTNFICNVWTMQQTTNQLTSKYAYYADANNHNMPVQYLLQGYNVVFGSHFDSYKITYHKFVDAVSDASVFELPDDVRCPLLAAGEGYRAGGVNDLGRMFPTHTEDEHKGVVRMLTEHLGKFVKDKASLDELEQHYWSFRSNLHFVNAVNRQRKSYALSLEGKPFAHLSFREIRKRLGLQKNKRAKLKKTLEGAGNGASAYHSVPTDFAADSVDPFSWIERGAVTDVKDQGVCGSCWAFGTHEAIEGANFVTNGELTRLSAQFLMDCGWQEGNNGCNGGLDSFAYNTVMRLQGIPTESSYKYLMADGYCSADVEKAVQVTGFVNITSGDEDGLLHALDKQGPISIAINVSPNLVFYSQGIFDDVDCLNGVNDLDHAVLLTGFGTHTNKNNESVDYWQVKNSWSTLWGEDGYVRFIKDDNNICGVATEPTYPLVQ
jgi:hypothetical protein